MPVTVKVLVAMRASLDRWSVPSRHPPFIPPRGSIDNLPGYGADRAGNATRRADFCGSVGSPHPSAAADGDSEDSVKNHPCPPGDGELPSSIRLSMYCKLVSC